MRLHYLRAILFIFFAVKGVQAQLHNCDGVWTNKTCDGAQPPTSTNTPLSIPQIENSDSSTMLSLYRKLDIERAKAKRQFGIDLEITRAHSACLTKTAQLESCQKTVEELEDKLYDRIQKEKLLAESKKQTELIEEKNKKGVEVGQLNSVTVYENDDHHHHRRPMYDRESSLSVRSGSTELSITEKSREEPFVPTPPIAKPATTPVDKNFKPQNRFQAGW